MQRRKPFRQLLIVFFAVTVPSVILLLFLHTSAINSLEKNNISIIRSNENMIVSSVEGAVKMSSRSAYSCAASMDFLTFCNSSPANRVNRYASNMAGKLRNALADYDEVIGFVLYNAACDKTYYTNFSAPDPAIYTDLPFGGSINAEGLKTDRGVFSYDGQIYITLSYRQHHGTLTVLLDPAKNEYYQSYTVSSDGSYPLCFLPTEAAGEAQETLISQQFSILPLQLAAPGASGQASVWRSPRQSLIFILILLILASILFVAHQTELKLIEPLALLWDSFDRISQGDTGYRIQEKTSLREIDDFYRGFNHMLDTLEEARSQREQSELDAAHARLQYFQLQIRPHFYLTCLKNIKAMASIHEDEKIQDMVIIMSDYLRYKMQDNRRLIPLREELEAVQGYVDLCRMMGSVISLDFDVSSDVLQVPTLPLSILTFAENSIKHGKNLEKTEIFIAVKNETDEAEEQYLNITVRDNGLGFQEEVLEELNRADSSELRYRKEHIGIANVRHRLRLVYGEKAGADFYNDGDYAVVHIRYPASAPEN